ncbi:MAG: hypothetical protein QOJ81_708 [Chloroflexota bacterium]|jgi:hypothetical protein|nr:hypothetical protein [Chloroflexota bacterium]
MGLATLSDVEVGRCVDGWRDVDGTLTNRVSHGDILVVDCSVPYDSEVTARFDHPSTAAKYPASIQDAARTGCAQLFAEYVGVDIAHSTLVATLAYPSAATWQSGDRSITCLASAATGELTTSVHGSRL